MEYPAENRLFSRRQILITTLLGGPLPAGYLLYRNFFNQGEKKRALRAKWTGYLGALAIYIVNLFLVEQLIMTEHMLRQNPVMAYGTTVLLFLVFHSLVGGWLFNKSLKQKDAIHQILPRPQRQYPGLYVLPWLLLGLALTIWFIVAGPFPFVFLVIYLLPNIYLYGHMKKAFAKGRPRSLFTVIFIAVVVLFPFSMITGEGSASLPLQWLRLAGYYYLPVLLYGLLLYLVFDLILLLNRGFRFLSETKLQLVRVRSIILSLVLLISGGFMAAGIHNFQNTRLHAYHIEVPRQEGHLDELRVAMAADIHLSRLTSKGFVDQFVDQMNAVEADLVLLPGDIVESGRETPRFGYFEKQFGKITAKYGVYAVEGNHEHYGRAGKFDFFEQAGIRLLRDTAVKIDNSAYLIGRRDRHVRNREPIGALMKQARENLPRLMMDHQPFNLEEAAQHDIDVQFSGHTHHGQLFPLNLITEAIYRISWGHEKIDDTHFFVTCGAQGWGPPVKTSSYSEIMVVNIDFVSQPGD